MNRLENQKVDNYLQEAIEERIFTMKEVNLIEKFINAVSNFNRDIKLSYTFDESIKMYIIYHNILKKDYIKNIVNLMNKYLYNEGFYNFTLSNNKNKLEKFLMREKFIELDSQKANILYSKNIDLYVDNKSIDNNIDLTNNNYMYSSVPVKYTNENNIVDITSNLKEAA